MPLIQHIAIVSVTPDITLRDVMTVSAALQKQVVRDMQPIWGFPATIDAFADLSSVPSDYYPVVLFSDPAQLAGEMVTLMGPEPAQRLLDQFEQGYVTGVHLNGITRQPFGVVSSRDPWTVVLSHEVMEMIVDPWGNHMIASEHPTRPQERVKYLVEICDPCMDSWYPVNGIAMADFYTPKYFDPVRVDGIRYSFTGAVTAPREILEGGYLTFLDPTESALYYQRWDEPEPLLLADSDLLARTNMPLRTLVDISGQTPSVDRRLLRAAPDAGVVDTPLRGVTEAARGAAQSTAGALYSTRGWRRIGFGAAHSTTTRGPAAARTCLGVVRRGHGPVGGGR